MINFIKGKIDTITPSYVIIETNGIGYKIFISTRDYTAILNTNLEVKLHCSFIIRENLQNLYGFTGCYERDLFETLINISGVGPKTALALISTLSIEEFWNAVKGESVAIISKVPGLGKKTAERLIIEMRDKCHILIGNTSTSKKDEYSMDNHNLLNDAVNALTNLGYNKKSSESTLKNIIEKSADKNYSLADLITEGLRKL